MSPTTHLRGFDDNMHPAAKAEQMALTERMNAAFQGGIITTAPTGSLKN